MRVTSWFIFARRVFSAEARFLAIMSTRNSRMLTVDGFDSVIIGIGRTLQHPSVYFRVHQEFLLLLLLLRHVPDQPLPLLVEELAGGTGDTTLRTWPRKTLQTWPRKRTIRMGSNKEGPLLTLTPYFYCMTQLVSAGPFIYKCRY